MVWTGLAAGAMVLTALAHSMLGEKRLITPILAIDDPLVKIARARLVIRLAWHLTSVFMVFCAALILWPHVPSDLVAVTGWLWLAVGLFDGAITKGQHVGWPLLTLAGVFTLLGVQA